jgi:hypothetical protein
LDVYTTGDCIVSLPERCHGAVCAVRRVHRGPLC